MEQVTVELDITESHRRRVWRSAAAALGFQERQANFLAFWYWLARQRGETKHRVERSESRLGVSNMQTSPDSLSAAAQNILDTITNITQQLQLHKGYNWTAHLDRSASTIRFRPGNELVGMQMDFTIGLRAFLELVRARRIIMLTYDDNAWTFRLRI